MNKIEECGPMATSDQSQHQQQNQISFEEETEPGDHTLQNEVQHQNEKESNSNENSKSEDVQPGIIFLQKNKKYIFGEKNIYIFAKKRFLNPLVVVTIGLFLFRFVSFSYSGV